MDWLGDPPPSELQVFEERAKSILSRNDSPDLNFTWSLNPYRGCFHACAYCMDGDTQILMADLSTRPLRDVRPGDRIMGTEIRGRYRRYRETTVRDAWSAMKPAFKIRLSDGTVLVASGDHRFLTERGWKHTTGAMSGANQRPYLTGSNYLIGPGHTCGIPKTKTYKRGYLCGLIRGDALIGHYPYERKGRTGILHQFRLPLIDDDGLWAIRNHRRADVARVEALIAWPTRLTTEWAAGFLAGIFDAEGSWSCGIFRIPNTDSEIISYIKQALLLFGFRFRVESKVTRTKPLKTLRLLGGATEFVRFVQIVDPAITRKCSIRGFALKNSRRPQVVSITPMGVVLPMYDLTTGTGDFIANGVVAHNCYARPSHQYWDWGAGTDFERKIVVKVNAARLLRKSFMKKSWEGEMVMLSGNTDCYQPIEASYEITRQVLEVFAEFRNPVGIVTKGMLIRRDVELLAGLASHGAAMVHMSIPFAHDDVARKIEPYTSSITQRFETLRILSEAGIPTGVAIAPIIPGLNDPDIPEILERAYEAGARSAFTILLRLPREVKAVFEERVKHALPPERVRKIYNAITETRGGRLYVADFGKRMRGEGPRWTAIRQLFEHHARRLGYNEKPLLARESPFVRPGSQGSLF